MINYINARVIDRKAQDHIGAKTLLFPTRVVSTKYLLTAIPNA